MEECETLIKTRFPNINDDIYSYCESKYLIEHCESDDGGLIAGLSEIRCAYCEPR